MLGLALINVVRFRYIKPGVFRYHSHDHVRRWLLYWYTFESILLIMAVRIKAEASHCGVVYSR